MTTLILLAMAMLLVTATEEAKDTSSKNCLTRSSDADFDYYLFMQQYAAGLCLVPNSLAANSSCSPKWTIHGLWPSTKHNPPQYCDYSEPFNASLFSESMCNELHKVWPSLENEGTGDEDFWEHEWCEHGTCACASGEIKDELEYFNTALRLYDKYDYDSILSQGGIRKSNTQLYNVTGIVDAFVNSDQVGTVPHIECGQYKENGKEQQVLTSMGLCFNKSFSFINCTDYKKQKCSDESGIKYPS